MNQHQKDINRIHQSEIYGSAIFYTVAKLTLNRLKKKKWQKLYELEVQTLEALLIFINKTQQHSRASFIWKVKGVFEGIILAILPWRLSMSLLEKGTQDFQKTFLRLKNNSNGEHMEFYSYVYAHEKAIESFAKLEQKGKKNSLEAVMVLLKRIR